MTPGRTPPEAAARRASRKRGLGQVLEQVIGSAQQALTAAQADELRRSKSQARVDLEYRNQLLATKAAKPRPGKNDYQVTAQVVHPKSGEPVAGLRVEALDKDVSRHDVLGAGVTDAKGEVTFVFKAKDFKESGEGLPEMVFRVAADRGALLSVSGAAVALKAGEPARVDIGLAADLAPRLDAFASVRERIAPSRRRAAAEAIVLHQAETQAAAVIGSAAQGMLAAGLAFVKARLKTPGG